MGTVRLGPVRVRTRRPPVRRAGAAGIRAPLAIAVVPCALAACGGDGPGHSGAETAYAEIVAEEDARGEAGLDRVRAHLASRDPDVRGWAARALGRLEDPGRVEELKPMLDDPEPVVRTAAAAAMAQAVYGRDPGVVLAELAARVRSESDPGALGGLAASLGRLSFADAAQRADAGEALEEIARGVEGLAEDPGLVAGTGLARGLEALARGGGKDAPVSPELVAVLEGLSRVRSENAGGPAAARIRRLAVAALARTGRLTLDRAVNLLADDDWGVRRQVMIWAADFGTGAGTLIRVGLGNPDPRVRVEALRAYDRRIRPGEGCPAILDAVGDPDPHVAATAIGLAARPCPDGKRQRRVLATLAREPEDRGRDWRMPARALHALAGVAPDEARNDIWRFARHANPLARAWAARAAGRARLAEALNDLSGDEDPNVRRAALEGLGAVAEGRGRERYLAALESDDPQLVMTAALLLVGHAAAETPVSRLLEPLARFTAARRETERDVRVALLEGIGAAGGFSGDDLAPYLTDFDPVVADLAAALLTESTGTVREAAPRRLPRTPTPGAARIRALAASGVRLRMAGLGDIVIALRPDLAATNADRFARLAREGYFDGLTFHRVAPNFVIQGGSPHGNEYMGDGPYSRDEISDHSHWRGTVGLSTRGRDTGDAQIFINLVDNPRLDFNYTVLGEVVEGMEIADAVREGAVIERADVVAR